MIEARLLGGDVGDVGEVGAAAFLGRHALLNESDREPEHRVDRPHPLGVAARQVVVERQDVHAVTGEGVQRRRHDGGERLALAGLHLDDVAAIEREGGEHLDVERPQAEDAARGVASERKERGANRFQRLPARSSEGAEARAAGSLAKLAGARLDLTV